MSRSNHISPDHFLDLENATSVSREEGMSAWERAYAELASRLSTEGKAGTVYIVFGLQGSGKTTWINTSAQHYPGNATFFEGPLPSKRHRERALAVCKAAGCEAVAVWMNTPFETALQRNAGRRGLAKIADDVIAHVRDSLEAPSLDEGFAHIMEIRSPEQAPSPSINRTSPRQAGFRRFCQTLGITATSAQLGGTMKATLILCASLAVLLRPAPAQAGPYGDDLSKCLVSSTTDTDKTLLVKWIFSAIALNKEVAPFVNLPHEVRSKLNEDTAGIYMRLLTDSCKVQTHDAFKYEGQAAISTAFQLLGQVASQGMFNDPAVAAGMTDLMKYFDEEKLNTVLQGE